MDIPQTVTSFIGSVVLYGGGTVTIVWLILKSLSEKWLDNKFAERAAALKLEQDKTLERVKTEISSLVSGALKIQEIEFKLLPDAWLLLEKSFINLSQIIMGFSWAIHLDHMTDLQVEEFLATTDFLESEKIFIRNAEKKEDTYMDIKRLHEMNACGVSNYELKRFIETNAIFFPGDIKTKFVKIADLCRQTHITQQMGFQYQNYDKQLENLEKLTNEIEPLKNEIEVMIHKRLHEHVTIEVSRLEFMNS